jgi:hypothetical protein
MYVLIYITVLYKNCKHLKCSKENTTTELTINFNIRKDTAENGIVDVEKYRVKSKSKCVLIDGI